MRSKHPIFTIGHSNRTLEAFVGVLRAHRIAVLVDIRSIPRSRANPQFNADLLAPALARVRIRYEHLAALGGLRKKTKDESESPNAAWESASFRNFADYAMTAPFREGLVALMQIGASDPTAIMCAEAVWWRCHRRIVTDHLLARGVPVVHLFTEVHEESANLTPFAVVEKGGLVTYPKVSSRPASAAARTRPGRARTAADVKR